MVDTIGDNLSLAVSHLHNSARVLFNIGDVENDVATQMLAARILAVTAEWLGARGVDA